MTCQTVRSLLPLVAGGDLSGRRLERVRTHLADCPPCREHLRWLQAGLAVLADVRDWAPVPQPDLWQRVGPRLAAARFASSGWRTGLSWRHLSAACAIVAAVAVGLALMPRDAGNGGPPVASTGSTIPARSEGTPTPPPVFVLDRAGNSWQHDMPDSAVRPSMRTTGRPRPIYVLEQGRAVGIPRVAEPF